MNKNKLKGVVRSNSDMHSFENYLLHGIYLTLYGFFKYTSFPLSNLIRYGILRLFSRNIHSKYVADGVMIWFPWNVKIGKNSSLNQGVLIDGYGGVNIGEGVRIAAYVCLNTADHEYADPDIFVKDQGDVVAEINIEDDVWIGTGTKINKGVRIGKGSVIGSGSVVTHDIPPIQLLLGFPVML